MERKKIELRNASATIGNSNQFTRQNKDRVAVPTRFDSSPAPAPRKGG
jgi:protein LSM12